MTTTKESPSNSAHRKLKQINPWEDRKYQATGKKKDKEWESNVDLAVHNQILKQQKN
jgi:hypothetical protein